MCAAVAAVLPSSPNSDPGATVLNETANLSTNVNMNLNVCVSGINGSGMIHKSSTICRYYLRGICRFGALCRFSHDAVGGEIPTNDGTDGNDLNDGVAETSLASTSAAANANEKVKKLTDWANAPAFVPSGKLFTCTSNTEEDEIDCELAVGNKTWAQVVGGDTLDPAGRIGYVQFSAPGSVEMLCPYENPCPYADYCAYTMHLELCKMCDMYCLHPTDLDQRRKHNQECLQQHEKDMELSFAIARSRDKTCGICMDTIMEKAGREKRFGILPNCTHIFCLECIRKWRQAKQFEHKITRSCPECRIASDFVCPSAFWVETKEEKDKLLSDYRAALGDKDCKYFKKGSGKCPFGNKCFYKHALANGDLVDVGCPRRARKILHQTNEIIDLLDIYLWEFVDHRDLQFLDLLSNTSDLTDDSDYDI